MTQDELKEGLNADMTDVDRLRLWARNIAESGGSNLLMWSDPRVVVEKLNDLAGRLDKEVRDVGTLRDKHLRVSEALAREQAWQPIETAPKTKRGVVVDLWCVTECHESAEFYFMATMCGVKDEKRWHGRVTECAWKDGAWRPVSGLSRHRLEVTPTHWMPLPSPPKEAK